MPILWLRVALGFYALGLALCVVFAEPTRRPAEPHRRARHGAGHGLPVRVFNGVGVALRPADHGLGA